MATLKDYFVNENNLKDFINLHDLRVFIETGTGMGDTVDFVRPFFKQVYSIEIIEEIADKAKDRFRQCKNVLIVNSESVEALEQIIDREPSILFFLDAHFPGADFGYAKYDSEKDPDRRIPMRKEIEAIVRLRGKAIKNDCFIIDDLRIYEDGPYGDGNWPMRKELGGEGIDFIYDAFAETHYIEKDYRFQGFIVLTPMR